MIETHTTNDDIDFDAATLMNIYINKVFSCMLIRCCGFETLQRESNR